MSASTPISALPSLSFLAVHGSTLKHLLNKAKSMEGSLGSIPQELEEVTKQLLRDLSAARGLFIHEALVCVLAKIEDTLEKFIKLDIANATRYKELAEEVRGFRFHRQSRSAVDSSQRPASVLEPEPEPEPTYQSLDELEKQCLLWFCLFPDGRSLSKRDVLYWWIGMSLMPESEIWDGGKKRCNDLLSDLKDGDFIEHQRPVVNKKALNVYRMRSGVRAKVMAEKAEPGYRSIKTAKLLGSFSVIHDDDYDKSEIEPEKVEALVNISEKILKAGRFRWLSKMKNAKIVHLGTWGKWHEKTEDYIVVEDEAELGKALEHLEKVKFLSLKGISGIVNLPDSVCKLENLRVLDLRACNNLELLPSEIGALKMLIHLDLSECHLLDHIPKGIAALTRLRVLKGFIISPYPIPPRHSKSKTPNNDTTSCALFSDLSRMLDLRTLTVRTRRLNFPTDEDAGTLFNLRHLTELRIAWVGNVLHIEAQSDRSHDEGLHREIISSLVRVRKLELEAVTDEIVRLMQVRNLPLDRLKKLYIKGGKIENIPWAYFPYIEEIHLRYLPHLRINWEDLRGSCPKLARVEVFECPNLMMFPCDETGVWERKNDR